MSLSKKIVLVASIPIFCQTALIISLLNLHGQTQRSAKQVEQVNSILKSINQLNYDVDALLVIIAIKRPVESDFERMRRFKNLSRQIDVDVADLKERAPQDSELLGTISDARAVKAQLMVVLLSAIKARAAHDFENGVNLPKKEVQILVEKLTDTIIPKLLRQQQRLFTYSYELSDQLRVREEQMVLLGSAVTVAVSVFGAIVVSQTVIRRIAVLKQNTERFAERQDLYAAAEGSDELSSLEQSFQRMAKTLRDKERRESLYIDGAYDGIISFDARYRIISANSAFCGIVDRGVEELIGVNLFTLVEKSSHASVLNLLKLAIDDTKRSTEIALLNSEDNQLDALISVQWQQSEMTFFCSIRDVTSERAAQRLKAEVIEMVTHDLKTPLCTVDNLLEALRLPESDENRNNNIGSAQRNVKRAVKLILDFLDIEKLESGSFPTLPELFPLTDLYPELEDAVLSLAEQKQISLQLSEEDRDIYADRGSILRVLVNLVGNAILHSSTGSRVRVYSRSVNGKTQVFVEDDGKGFEPDDVSKVFERFYQKKRTVSGSGLGLTICKYLVEQQNGSITADAKKFPDHGAIFCLVLPSGLTELGDNIVL